jgi:integrase
MSKPLMSADEFHALCYQSTRVATDAEQVLADLLPFVSDVAGDRKDKGAGRSKIADYIRASMPSAQREGRTQVLVLGAAHHVVENGGMRGEPLAPVTLYEYFRLTLKRVQRRLLAQDPEAFDPEGFWALYRDVIEDSEIPSSDRKKVAAMLEVFHRFLVIVGCEPLRRSLTTGGYIAPPAAATVWPEELEKAVQEVHCAAVHPRVKAQCELALRLAYQVPLRSYEVWCIRLGDITGQELVTLDIYPRRRDGVRKTTATRRQVDIRDRVLAGMLLDAQKLRRDEGALDEDVLLGDPGKPDGRFEEALSTRLMNWALKRGTGVADAGFHDLRHGAISRAAIPVLLGGRFAA